MKSLLYFLIPIITLSRPKQTKPTVQPRRFNLQPHPLQTSVLDIIFIQTLTFTNIIIIGVIDPFTQVMFIVFRPQ